MDTMEITKIGGAVCGAFLIFLLINWVGEEVYHVEAAAAHGAEDHGDDHGGHGKEAKSAFFIEVAQEGGAAEAKEEGPAFADVLASADAEKGAKVFSKCKACHKLEAGANGTGPHLFAVVGRDIAAEAGFSYSAALSDLPGNWDAEALNGFLENPKKYAKGTKMAFSGLKKITDRANLVAYLETIK